MGISNLSRLCAAVLFATSLAPALAADPPVPRANVSVNLNPTTSYYTVNNTTVRLPNGVSVSPSSASLPVVTKYPAGLQQTIPTGITIDAIKKSAPLPAVVRAKTPSVNNAAKTLLRGNLAGLVLGLGLDSLLDGIGALIDDAGTLNVPDKGPLGSVPPPLDYKTYRTAISGYNTSLTTCETQTNDTQLLTCFRMGTNSAGRMTYRVYECPKTYSGYNLSGTLAPPENGAYGRCYYGGSSAPLQAMVPASPEFIDEAVDNSYIAEPSDWTNLTPYLDLDDIEITWAPTLEGNPQTHTVYDADGNPVKVQETNIWYDFDIRDNPSPAPALDLKTREETKTYEDGVLTGTTSTTNTASGGAGGNDNPPPEVPTDCDFMPTVCAFLDWFKDDNLDSDPDLRSIMKDDEDFAKSKTISFGAAVCPAPHTIHIPSLSMSVDLSFEFFCQFAEYARALVLAAAYIIAAYISLGVARA